MGSRKFMKFAVFAIAPVLFIVGKVPADTFSDNFNATGNPGPANDYNLNAELEVRQSGTLAPAQYTRLSGAANYSQVNNSTPDTYGTESGLGKLDFFSIAFPAVQLDVIPANRSLLMTLEATPVANNALRDSIDWPHLLPLRRRPGAAPLRGRIAGGSVQSEAPGSHE